MSCPVRYAIPQTGRNFTASLAICWAYGGFIMSQDANTLTETRPEGEPPQGPHGPQESSPLFSRRTLSWLISGALVVVVIASIFVVNGLANRTTDTGSSAPKSLLGVVLDKTPAPDITLKDQDGTSYQLSQQHGKLIVLTFIDSYCPPGHQMCQITAVGLRVAVKDLGKQANQVEWVALSMNPADTPASAAAFLKNNGVTFPVHYLLGTQAQLTPLWAAYHMASQPDPTVKGVVDHSTGIYIIDQQGNERVFLEAGSGVDPHQITNDVQYLLAH